MLRTHVTQLKPAVADIAIEDDRLIEVSRTGELLWEWVASDHIDEFKFSSDARNVIKAGPAANGPAGAAGRGSFDWLHVNSAGLLNLVEERCGGVFDDIDAVIPPLRNGTPS